MTSSRITRFAAALLGMSIASVLAARPVGAHSGLSTNGLLEGVRHPVAGPDHLLAMVAVGVLAASAGSRRIAWFTPLGFLVGMVVGGAFGLADAPFPGVETTIALSVVVLGALIVAVSDVDGWVLPALAAVFGAVHGHAHGAELPESANAVAYGLGFIGTTAALHLCGTAAGIALRRSRVVRTLAGITIATAGVGLLIGI
jgi:urease accessory protein